MDNLPFFVVVEPFPNYLINKSTGVNNKGVGLFNEAVPVQFRPFGVGGSQKTLPR